MKRPRSEAALQEGVARGGRLHLVAELLVGPGKELAGVLGKALITVDVDAQTVSY